MTEGSNEKHFYVQVIAKQRLFRGSPPTHPWVGRGFPWAYMISYKTPKGKNAVLFGDKLSLQPGKKHYFDTTHPSIRWMFGTHPFYFTKSSAGGGGTGFGGKPRDPEKLFPDKEASFNSDSWFIVPTKTNMPAPIYYQCTNHTYMGGPAEIASLSTQCQICESANITFRCNSQFCCGHLDNAYKRAYCSKVCYKQDHLHHQIHTKGLQTLKALETSGELSSPLFSKDLLHINYEGNPDGLLCSYKIQSFVQMDIREKLPLLFKKFDLIYKDIVQKPLYPGQIKGIWQGKLGLEFSLQNIETSQQCLFHLTNTMEGHARTFILKESTEDVDTSIQHRENGIITLPVQEKLTTNKQCIPTMKMFIINLKTYDVVNSRVGISIIALY